jgi:hypothetical protein
MHILEPHYNWRHLYTAEEDSASPFFNRTYSEFEFSDRVYDHFIHPQWDNIGSSTLFIKLIYCNYDQKFAIIELIGEWNDCLYNDVMTFKREIIDHLINEGISNFVLIGENVLNFHYSDDCYYEEWADDIEEGWIAAINFQPHVLREMEQVGIDQYLLWGGELNDFNWRTFKPQDLKMKIDGILNHRLGI